MRRVARSRQRVRRSLVRPIDPLTIGGLVLDFNMLNVGSYAVTGGNTVTSITNTVSAVAASEATNPPTYEATGLSGKPCMRGDGVARQLIWTEAAVSSVLSGTDPSYTAFFVVQPMASASGVLMSCANAASNVGLHAFFTGSTGTLARAQRISDAGGTQSVTVINTSAVAQVLAYRGAGAVLSGSINGGALASVASTGAAQTPTRCALFQRGSLGTLTYSDARLGRVLLFNSALTNAQVRGVGVFLKGLWGIS